MLGLGLRQHSLLSCCAFVPSKGNQHQRPDQQGLEQLPTGLAGSSQVLQLEAANTNHCLTRSKEQLVRL